MPDLLSPGIGFIPSLGSLPHRFWPKLMSPRCLHCAPVQPKLSCSCFILIFPARSFALSLSLSLSAASLSPAQYPEFSCPFKLQEGEFRTRRAREQMGRLEHEWKPLPLRS